MASRFFTENQQKVRYIKYNLPHIDNFKNKRHLSYLTTKFLEDCSVQFMSPKQLKHVFILKNKKDDHLRNHEQYKELKYISDIFMHDNIQEVYVSQYPLKFETISSDPLTRDTTTAISRETTYTPVKSFNSDYSEEETKL